MQESKSCALPLGDSPVLFDASLFETRAKPDDRKVIKVGDGTRTHDIQIHNLAR